jgi:hypothetical protein
MLAQIKPARLYERKASEALYTIEASCMARPQPEKGPDIILQAMLVLQTVPVNRPTRL